MKFRESVVCQVETAQEGYTHIMFLLESLLLVQGRQLGITFLHQPLLLLLPQLVGGCKLTSVLLSLPDCPE